MGEGRGGRRRVGLYAAAALLVLGWGMPAVESKTLNMGILAPILSEEGLLSVAVAYKAIEDINAFAKNTTNGTAMNLPGKMQEWMVDDLELNLIFRDSKGDPATAVDAAIDLIFNDVKSIVGPVHTLVGITLAIITAGPPYNIPLTSPGAQTTWLSSAWFKGFSRTVPSDVFSTKAMAALLEEMNFRRIAAIIPNDPQGTSYISSLVNNLPRGITVESTYVYTSPSYTSDTTAFVDPRTQDFETDTSWIQAGLERIKDAKLRVILCLAWDWELPAILNVAHKLGMVGTPGYIWIFSDTVTHEVVNYARGDMKARLPRLLHGNLRVANRGGRGEQWEKLQARLRSSAPGEYPAEIGITQEVLNRGCDSREALCGLVHDAVWLQALAIHKQYVVNSTVPKGNEGLIQAIGEIGSIGFQGATGSVRFGETTAWGGITDRDESTTYASYHNYVYDDNANNGMFSGDFVEVGEFSISSGIKMTRAVQYPGKVEVVDSVFENDLITFINIPDLALPFVDTAVRGANILGPDETFRTSGLIPAAMNLNAAMTTEFGTSGFKYKFDWGAYPPNGIKPTVDASTTCQLVANSSDSVGFVVLTSADVEDSRHPCGQARPIWEDSLVLLVKSSRRTKTVTEAFFMAVTSPASINAMCLLLCLIVISGHLVWFFEHRNNGSFPEEYITGIDDAIWWAGVTVTTVGYGDVIPKTPMGRILCFCWMLIGLMYYSFFMGIVGSEIEKSQASQQLYYGLRDLRSASSSMAGSCKVRIYAGENVYLQAREEVANVVGRELWGSCSSVDECADRIMSGGADAAIVSTHDALVWKNRLEADQEKGGDAGRKADKFADFLVFVGEYFGVGGGRSVYMISATTGPSQVLSEQFASAVAEGALSDVTSVYTGRAALAMSACKQAEGDPFNWMIIIVTISMCAAYGLLNVVRVLRPQWLPDQPKWLHPGDRLEASVDATVDKIQKIGSRISRGSHGTEQRERGRQNGQVAPESRPQPQPQRGVGAGVLLGQSHRQLDAARQARQGAATEGRDDAKDAYPTPFLGGIVEGDKLVVIHDLDSADIETPRDITLEVATGQPLARGSPGGRSITDAVRRRESEQYDAVRGHESR